MCAFLLDREAARRPESISRQDHAHDSSIIVDEEHWHSLVAGADNIPGTIASRSA